MCGLCGAISLSKTVGLFQGEIDKFRQLLIMSQLRGQDSTGIMSMAKAKKNDGNVGKAIYTYKSLGNSSNFLELKEARNIVYKQDTLLLAAHCRSATVGNVLEENAHPFKCDNIYGMHNGTISAFANTKTTDSQVLFEHIHTYGWRHTLSNMIKGGAYAITFLDLERQTFNIIRNAQRSLYFMEHNQVLYYASEYEMLSLLRSRESMGFDTAIRPFEAEVLYTYNLKDLTDQKKYPLKLQVETHSAVPVLSASKPSPPFLHKENYGTQYPKIEGTYHAYRGKVLNPEKATKLLVCGCTLCHKKGNLNGKAYWFNNDAWVCEVCVEDPVFKNYINKEGYYESKYVKETFSEGTGKEDNDGGFDDLYSRGDGYMC